jgi:hypothetical protein
MTLRYSSTSLLVLDRAGQVAFELIQRFLIADNEEKALESRPAKSWARDLTETPLVMRWYVQHLPFRHARLQHFAVRPFTALKVKGLLLLRADISQGIFKGFALEPLHCVMAQDLVFWRTSERKRDVTCNLTECSILVTMKDMTTGMQAAASWVWGRQVQVLEIQVIVQGVLPDWLMSIAR